MKRAIEQFAQAAPDVPSIRQSAKVCATSEDLREGLAAQRTQDAGLQGPLTCVPGLSTCWRARCTALASCRFGGSRAIPCDDRPVVDPGD